MATWIVTTSEMEAGGRRVETRVESDGYRVEDGIVTFYLNDKAVLAIPTARLVYAKGLDER